jgi:hypothetical protein
MTYKVQVFRDGAWQDAPGEYDTEALAEQAAKAILVQMVPNGEYVHPQTRVQAISSE